MSNVSRGLFDPRQKFQTWPEPNDDPNIPYVWGMDGHLDGYQIGNNPPATSDVEQPPVPTEPVEPTTVTSGTAQYILGASVVLGLFGMYRGYNKSQQVGTSQKALDALASGIIYATGVGAVVEEVRDA